MRHLLKHRVPACPISVRGSLIFGDEESWEHDEESGGLVPPPPQLRCGDRRPPEADREPAASVLDATTLRSGQRLPSDVRHPATSPRFPVNGYLLSGRSLPTLTHSAYIRGGSKPWRGVVCGLRVTLYRTQPLERSGSVQNGHAAGREFEMSSDRRCDGCHSVSGRRQNGDLGCGE